MGRFIFCGLNIPAFHFHHGKHQRGDKFWDLPNNTYKKRSSIEDTHLYINSVNVTSLQSSKLYWFAYYQMIEISRLGVVHYQLQISVRLCVLGDGGKLCRGHCKMLVLLYHQQRMRKVWWYVLGYLLYSMRLVEKRCCLEVYQLRCNRQNNSVPTLTCEKLLNR